MQKALLCLLILSIPQLSQAQVIGGTSGDAATGNELFISGNDFGNKPQDEPLLWDDMSSYSQSGLSHGDQIPFNDGPWVAAAWAIPIYYNNSSGLRVPGRALYGTSNNRSFLTGPNFSFGQNETLSINWWFYSDMEEHNSGAFLICKILRLWSPNDTATRIDVFERGTMNNNIRQYWDLLTQNQWHHMQVDVFNSSGMTEDPSTTQARYRVILNGQVLFHVPMTGRLENGGGTVSRPHRIGFDSRQSSDFEPGGDFRYGDIYMDKGQSKVLIADTDNFQWNNPNPVHWEIQPVKTWSDTGINIDFNSGSFIPGDPAYLYVVDSSGSISNAHQIEIGEQTEFQGPGLPGQPERVIP